MLRRRIFIVTLAGCLGAATLLATERATFILTDGERISGLVVFHTESRENLIAGNLNIGTPDGREQTIPLGQVAVIDFVGGKPSTAELAALPAGANQLLALRNGTTRLGHFVNLIGGDTVRWQNAAGGVQELPIRDVNRIYLNADSARIAFDYTPPATVTPPIVLPPNSPAGRSGRPANGLDVPAAVQWTDSGITVSQGEMVTFSVSGVVAFSRAPGDTAGPDGNSQLRRDSYPVRGVGAGALIGRVGRSAPFFIGVGGQPVAMPANGPLLLGVNDDKFDDNSGSFRVAINRAFDMRSGDNTRRGRPSANGLDVPAAVQWTDTGITVSQGEMITFSVSGVVAFSRAPGDTAGPDGNSQLRRDSYPVRGVGAGALIGKVGRSAPFFIGVGGQQVAMPANGPLLLGVNDDKFDDNSGSFRVVITRGSDLRSGDNTRPGRAADRLDVPAAVQWTDSGINVSQGEMVTFSVSGVVAFSRGPGDTAGPDGNSQLRRDSYPVGGVGAGAFIGKVGRSAPFFIGVGGQPVAMPANGRLQLGVNDDRFDDNSGSFRVVITRGWSH